MSQCPYCALSKISQKISWTPPANKAIQPFYRVLVNLLNLEEGWDNYQGDGAIIRRAMVVIREVTGINVENLTLKSILSSLLATNQLTSIGCRYQLRRRWYWELDEAIKHIEVPELEAKEIEDIQLGEDPKVDAAIMTITCQADHEAEDLDVNHDKAEE